MLVPTAVERPEQVSVYSPLRHAGLAQAGEISGFEQGADLREAEIPDGR
jgi:hypothetical protein